jgi:LEA14-like dessication related protein|tara:strand:+ start:162 stop:605 length:444 start_codon:yes stop_codon:yes gene_type:complete
MIVLIAVSSFGCNVRKPVAQYNKMTVTQSTSEAIALAVEFEVFNTNDEPLKLMMYEYTVNVHGATCYRGLASAEQTVPRWSSTMQTIPVVIRRDVLDGQDVIAWSLHGSLGYIPTKEVSITLLEANIWKPTTTVRANGLLELPEIAN